MHTIRISELIKLSINERKENEPNRERACSRSSFGRIQWSASTDEGKYKMSAVQGRPIELSEGRTKIEHLLPHS